jgi:MFS family permease
VIDANPATDTIETPAAGWRDLLGRDFLGISTLLAGGVGLYATNEFITVSLLPSTVADIGGLRLYAWVTTLYLVGSVVAAVLVKPLLERIGARSSYLLGLAVFGLGSVVCATAPSMHTLLVGRTLQGAAGGLLTGLSYAIINAALPRSLWTRASALVAAMWGVATVAGPAIGGVFAQFGLWRYAFAAVALLTMAAAVLVPRVLSAGRGVDRDEAPPVRVPLWSLLLLGLAALCVSVAEVPHKIVAMVGLLLVSVVLVVLFIVLDRRAKTTVLPPSVFGAGPLKWIYVTMGLLMGVTMVDMYVPLFGQRLAHLSPVLAGFLGAALAIGWTLGELVSVSLHDRQAIARIVAAGPLVVAAGLALCAFTQVDNAGRGTVALWSFALLISGIGIGMAWPHLSAWAMETADDTAEGGSAAVAINTVQLISGAYAGGLAGVVVNAAGGSEASPARWLFAMFACFGAVGALASYRAGRGQR